MIKVIILVIGTLLQTADGPSGQSKMFLQETLASCEVNAAKARSLSDVKGIQIDAKCVTMEFVKPHERGSKDV